MNEEKKDRTIPEIQAEYSQLCARAGQLQYQIYCLQKDLDLANGTLKDLNFEAAAIQAKQTEAPKAEETKND